MSLSVFWLKDDFRISNNQAIKALIEDKSSEKKTIYIYEKHKYQLCETQKWWLARSLEIFKEKLESLKIMLDVVHENSTKSIKKLITNSSLTRIYWNF